MAALEKTYSFIFDDIADKRVQDWKLMKGPEFLLGILAIYFIGLKITKIIMINRERPFSLKNIIICYNIFQIFACAIIIYGVSTSGWTTYYSWGCQLPDYSDNPLALRMLKFMYCTFFVKCAELIETFFFVLRKKFNQVSFLHVYHHGTSVVFAWIGVKYIGGGMATFPIIINSFIHILMYTYYLLSSLGPKWQKRISKWKSKLTTLQMVQFCILVGHSLLALKPECRNSPAVMILYLYIPHVFIVFYMFWDFYNKTYTKTDTRNKKM